MCPFSRPVLSPTGKGGMGLKATALNLTARGHCPTYGESAFSSAAMEQCEDTDTPEVKDAQGESRHKTVDIVK